jgi:8-amino-3,8-dideoxy-alpha-D-manno-octulosonate transaminase
MSTDPSEGDKPCVVDKPASYHIGPQEIGEEEIELVTAALRRQDLFRFFKKPGESYTGQFEEEFRELTQVRYALAVNSGTSALICGLVGIGVGSGDEVIVPAYTYIATAAAVLAVRAIPVIAEIDESLTLDPADVEKKISPRTKAIIPVHMRGTPSRMDEIMAIAKKHGLKVLEDCAQCNGGIYKGRPVGSIGDAGAFSLQQFKIITAGEGGAIVTNDKLTFDRAGCYHDAAFSFWMQDVPDMRLGIPPFLGENYRMSELNGALALAQVRKRERILAQTRAIKRRMLA